MLFVIHVCAGKEDFQLTRLSLQHSRSPVSSKLVLLHPSYNSNHGIVHDCVLCVLGTFFDTQLQASAQVTCAMAASHLASRTGCSLHV